MLGRLGRWVIVRADQPAQAWTGSAWATHFEGIPTGRAQISNFGSKPEAAAEARRAGFSVAGWEQSALAYHEEQAKLSTARVSELEQRLIKKIAERGKEKQ